MKKVIIISGYVLLTIELLSIIPITDLLPVDMWAKIINIFSSVEETTYYKVVPSKHGYTSNIIIIALGLILIAAGKFITTKKTGDKANNNA